MQPHAAQAFQPADPLNECADQLRGDRSGFGANFFAIEAAVNQHGVRGIHWLCPNKKAAMQVEDVPRLYSTRKAAVLYRDMMS